MELTYRFSRLSAEIPAAPGATMFGFVSYITDAGKVAQLGPFFGTSEAEVRKQADAVIGRRGLLDEDEDIDDEPISLGLEATCDED